MADSVSVRTFAKLEGVSHTLVNRAVARGVLVADADGKLDPALVGTWRKASGKKSKPPRPSVEAENSDPPSDNWKQIADALPGKTFEEKAANAAQSGDMFATYADAEKAKMIFQALMQEHKYNEAIGAVVPVEAVADLVGDKFAAVRSRFMAIPSEEAPRVHRCKTVMEVQAALLDVVTEALEEIASGDIVGEVQARA